MMIKNDIELNLAIEERESLIIKVDAMKLQHVDYLTRRQIDIFSCMIDRLSLDISKYMLLRDSPKYDYVFDSSVDMCDDAIISMRISSGTSIDELSSKIESNTCDIENMEQQCYFNARFDRILQIIRECGYKMIITKK